MEKNKGLNVLVIILILCILGLGGYIIYDKVLSTDKNINGDADSGIENNAGNNDYTFEYGLNEQLEISFEKIYGIYTSPNPYCGNKVMSDKKFEYGYYYVSTEYSSYQDMVNSLREYASEKIISSGKNTKDNYLEENGKLYCKDMGKGGIYSYEDSLIQINDKTEFKINSSIVVMLSYFNPNYNGNNAEKIYTYDLLNVVYENEDGNWIITSIEYKNKNAM